MKFVTTYLWMYWAIYLRDFGVQLGYAMDYSGNGCCLSTVTNPMVSESAPVIGVYETTNGITYKDLLHIWVRAARMGRNFYYYDWW